MSALTFDWLRIKNVQRCEDVFHPLNDWSASDWACAMAGECGEACNAVKKLKRCETKTNTVKDPQTPEECVKAIGKELADIVIYTDLLAAHLGIDLGQVVIEKFNEVSDRMGSYQRL